MFYLALSDIGELFCNSLIFGILLMNVKLVLLVSMNTVSFSICSLHKFRAKSTASIRSSISCTLLLRCVSIYFDDDKYASLNASSFTNCERKCEKGELMASNKESMSVSVFFISSCCTCLLLAFNRFVEFLSQIWMKRIFDVMSIMFFEVLNVAKKQRKHWPISGF